MAIFNNKNVDSIFSLAGVPSFSEFYDIGMFNWKCAYRGYLPQWHEVKTPTIADPNHIRRKYKINLAKALCSELANLIWAEGSRIAVSMKNHSSDDKDPLQEYIDRVLEDNLFSVRIRQLIEQSCALGGATIRTYADGVLNDEGEIKDGTAHICLAYGMADKFIPLAWDNKRVTEGVFIEKKAYKGWYYTKLEFHKWNGVEYVVSTEVYKTDHPFTGNTAQDILGIRSPMSEVWNATTSAPVEGLQLGMFTYFHTNVANNLDDNSPLGISVYANAMDTLRALDDCFDSLIMELKLGKKRIIVPAQAVRSVRDHLGRLTRYFDTNDEVYEALNFDSTTGLEIKDNSVSLRIGEHVQAFNSLLNILSVQVGLSEGALSFDAVKGMKTATEVVSENSKTYRTIKLLQEPIAQSIKDLVRQIIDVSCAYDIKTNVNGREVAVYDLVKGGYDVSVSFDDSIIQDRSSDLQQGILLVQNNLLSKKSYLLDYLKLTPEQAEVELSRLAAENSARTLNIDWSSVEV